MPIPFLESPVLLHLIIMHLTDRWLINNIVLESLLFAGFKFKRRN